MQLISINNFHTILQSKILLKHKMRLNLNQAEFPFSFVQLCIFCFNQTWEKVIHKTHQSDFYQMLKLLIFLTSLLRQVIEAICKAWVKLIQRIPVYNKNHFISTAFICRKLTLKSFLQTIHSIEPLKLGKLNTANVLFADIYIYTQCVIRRSFTLCYLFSLWGLHLTYGRHWGLMEW